MTYIQQHNCGLLSGTGLVHVGNTAPTNAAVGQLWYHTDPAGDVLKLLSALNTWVPVSGGGGSGGGGIVVGANPPTATAGAAWLDTGTNTLKVHDGTSWVVIGPVTTKPPVVSSTTPPAGAAVGDLWLNTGTNALSVYDGANWVVIGPATANPPVVSGPAAPTGAAVGDLWLNTGTNALSVYDGAKWTVVGPAAAKQTVVSGAAAPAGAALGDLWLDTSGANPVVKILTALPSTWTAFPASKDYVERAGDTFVSTTLNDYGETAQNLGNVTGAIAIDISAGQTVIAKATGPITGLTITNPTGHVATSFVLLLDVGSQTVAWAGVDHWFDSVPDTTTPGIYGFAFELINGLWYGSHRGLVI